MGRSRFLRMPSPAMVVACIALAVALGGSATAAVVALKKNSVRSVHIKNNQVRGVDVNEATLGRVPSAAHALSAQTSATAQNAANADRLGGLAPGAFGTQRWAVVNADGSLARSSGGVSSQRDSEGAYFVDFGSPVNDCAWTATLGDPGLHTGAKGGISTGIRALLVSIDPVAVYAPVNDTISVITFSGTTAVDLPFHLAVYC